MFARLFARFHHPYLLLTLTTLFWSGNMVIGRAIRDDVPPLSLAFWRWMIALALTLPLALPHLRTQWPLLKRGWRAIVALGLLGVGGYNTLAYIALQYTAATNAVLLNSFIPIATIALSWVFLHKHLRGIEWFGVLISLAGVTTIVARGDAELGLQQVSELIPIAGIDYIGPLPPDVQQTTFFSAGIVVGAKEPEAARVLIKFFTSTTAAPIISKSGLEPMTLK